MSKIKEIFDKDNETVINATREAHESIYRQVHDARKDRQMSVGDLTNAAGAGPAMTARFNDCDKNLTLMTIQRYAASVGKVAKIELVDADECE